MTHNRGMGAGGSNTTRNGFLFEEKTNIRPKLLEKGYSEYNLVRNPKKAHHYYLSKKIKNKTVIFVYKNGLKLYLNFKYNIDIFRFPDEAYIIEYESGEKTVIIIEKKNQNVDGSVETKLWSGPSLKREYEIVLNDFTVHYVFVVNSYYKTKFTSDNTKFIILNTILNENDIVVFFGDDENYFDFFFIWFNNFL